MLIFSVAFAIGYCTEDATVDVVYGPLKWPVTAVGSQAESLQRCPLLTERGKLLNFT